jgi:hypothetical protein
MYEVSILLKDQRFTTLSDYRALEKYATTGKIWSIIENRSVRVKKQRSVEYIFESENYFLFKLVSQNALINWYTQNTRSLKLGESYQIKDDLFIELYSYTF